MRRTSETTIHLTVEEVIILLTRDGGKKGKCPAEALGVDDFQIMLKGYVSDEPNSWCGFCSEDCYWNGESFELDDSWEKFSIWCRDKKERDEIFGRLKAFFSKHYKSCTDAQGYGAATRLIVIHDGVISEFGVSVVGTTYTNGKSGYTYRARKSKSNKINAYNIYELYSRSGRKRYEILTRDNKTINPKLVQVLNRI